MPDRKSPEQIVEKVDEIPTLPTVVYELNQIIADPMSSTADVEKVMANDQSLTTRVLKLANSAYYAIPGGVTSLSRAIAYLGFDTVQQLVLTATIMDSLKSKGSPTTFSAAQFWQHSMGVAMASESVAKFIKHSAHADIFTCGLLHDLGKMALYLIEPQTLDMLCKHAVDNQLNLDEAEQALEQVRHTVLGNALTKKWKLPNKIQAVCQYHHTFDNTKRSTVSSEISEIIDIVVLANLLVHALKFGASGHSKVVGAPKILLERLKISPDDLRNLSGEIKKSFSAADMFLQIIKGG